MIFFSVETRVMFEFWSNRDNHSNIRTLSSTETICKKSGETINWLFQFLVTNEEYYLGNLKKKQKFWIEKIWHKKPTISWKNHKLSRKLPPARTLKKLRSCSALLQTNVDKTNLSTTFKFVENVTQKTKKWKAQSDCNFFRQKTARMMEGLIETNNNWPLRSNPFLTEKFSDWHLDGTPAVGFKDSWVWKSTKLVGLFRRFGLSEFQFKGKNQISFNLRVNL